MSADGLLARWARPARWRAGADALLCALPLALVAALVGRVSGGTSGALIGAAIGLAATIWWVRRQVRQRGAVWLVRRLDTRRRDMEDSAALLLVDPASLGPLQRLQRDRLEARLAIGVPEAIRDDWSHRTILAAWTLALGSMAGVALWPSAESAPPLSASSDGALTPPGRPRLSGQRVRIVPPSYTGLPARFSGSLDIEAPTGSVIQWTLRFQPQPSSARITLDDKRSLPLRFVGGLWTAEWRLDRSRLYRVVPVAGSLMPPLHRLQAIGDRPPRVRVTAPASTLVTYRPGQRRWALSWAATDDHGVAPTADLRFTAAIGEGESVRFAERRLRIRGSGGRRTRTFSAIFDPLSLGLVAGSDLVVQLIVADTQPKPQHATAPAVVLRWPGTQADAASGLEGMARRVMPAYFRSQRQIIIDAEALLARRRGLSADVFEARSDAIGVDQQLLRLRYGQFLGEEDSGGARTPALPTADAPTEDDHDGAGVGPEVTADGAAAAFGHVHDHAEAATLIDPDTRALLRQALDQMWQSELHLRQGEPARALPFAHKALIFIKQVQQATRIFLARVGPVLPPIDLARRMTGKREGLADRAIDAPARRTGDPAPQSVWRALRDAKPDLRALEQWVGAHGDRIRDPLALRTAIDAVRRDHRCEACRDRLAAQLWPALPRPPAEVRRRNDGGTIGRRYLEALR